MKYIMALVCCDMSTRGKRLTGCLFSGHRNCNALLQLCAALSSCPVGLLYAYHQFRCPTFEKHPCYCTAGSVGLPFLCELVRGRQQEKSEDGAR